MNYVYPLASAVRQRMSGIRLAIFDIDGVMTNGQLIFTDSGEEAKAFHVHDGLGIKWLMNHGIEVAVITARKPPVVGHRLKGLGVQYYYHGMVNKLDAYADLKAKLTLSDDAIAYTGDDLIDVGIMRQCGMAFAVPNGHERVKKIAHLTLKHAGGAGAVREVSELLLDAQGKLEGILSSY